MVRAYVLAAIRIALIGVAGQLFSAKTIDLFYHDTYYVLAPLHIAFAGALLFGAFAGASFLCEKLTGRKLSAVLGYLHLGVTAVSFLALFLAGWLMGSQSGLPHPDGKLGQIEIAVIAMIAAFFPVQILFPVNLAWSWWRGRRDHTASARGRSRTVMP